MTHGQAPGRRSKSFGVEVNRERFELDIVPDPAKLLHRRKGTRSHRVIASSQAAHRAPGIVSRAAARVRGLARAAAIAFAAELVRSRRLPRRRRSRRAGHVGVLGCSLPTVGRRARRAPAETTRCGAAILRIVLRAYYPLSQASSCSMIRIAPSLSRVKEAAVLFDELVFEDGLYEASLRARSPR